MFNNCRTANFPVSVSVLKKFQNRPIFDKVLRKSWR